MHGHNWTVRVYYEFDELDSRGVTVDYVQLKRSLEAVILGRFDHRHLNDVPPFDAVNPTSEHLAREIYAICRDSVDIPRGTLVAVELWETPVDMVRYRED
jgi:6-pyruvoyltetrahydropterin/6-carboxytetrahydropterin synthase